MKVLVDVMTTGVIMLVTGCIVIGTLQFIEWVSYKLTNRDS